MRIAGVQNHHLDWSLFRAWEDIADHFGHPSMAAVVLDHEKIDKDDRVV